MADDDWWDIPFKKVILGDGKDGDTFSGFFSDHQVSPLNVSSLGLEVRVQLRRRPTTGGTP